MKRTKLLLPILGSLILSTGLAHATDLSSLVPDDIKAKGYIDVVVDPSFGPPWNYYPGADQSVVAGMDPELAAGIAERLGVEIRYNSLAFVGIIPAMQAGRYDMAMSGMFAREERIKVIDLVSYAKDSTAVIVPTGNPLNIQAAADLCGKSVASVIGSTQLILLEAQSQKCATPINISTFPNMTDAMLQVETKRVDGVLNGAIVSGYLNKSGALPNKGLEPVFPSDFPSMAIGIGFPKDKTALRDAVLAAINDMIQDGSYNSVFEKYGVNMNVAKAELNKSDLP
jgi:polar amino acid transport system substrate-binding protein